MMKRFTMYLDLKAVKTLRQIAERKGVKMAQLIRIAISEYVERNK
jgi:predicted transcriptional regulator